MDTKYHPVVARTRKATALELRRIRALIRQLLNFTGIPGKITR